MIILFVFPKMTPIKNLFNEKQHPSLLRLSGLKG
jgi:hypothetical protein